MKRRAVARSPERHGGDSGASSAALFPLFLAALLAYALAAPSLAPARALGLPDAANPTLVLLGAIAIFYPIVAGLERWRPERPEWRRPQGDVRADALHLALTGPGATALFDATLRGAAVAAGAALTERLGWSAWPSGWPLAAQLLLALAVAELGHYAFHRLSHENALVWRVHAAHHSAARLYWLNATRFHPLDLFALLACQTVPLLLLGAPREALLSYTVFAAVYGQLQHANLRLRTGPLDYVFSTPGLHRWHHSTDPREGNSNYGAILSIWDLAFGTFLRPPAPFAGPIGIGDLPEFPRSYLGQLASPFRWARIRATARPVD